VLSKFIRFFGSSIEEEIVTSFGDVALGEEKLVRRKFGESLLENGRKIAKRSMDILVPSLLICISWPFFLFIAAAIKIFSRGTVFFKQKRVGYQENVFSLWKFRTMEYETSEEEHRKYVQYLLKEGSKAESKIDLLTNYIAYVDNRTTKVGRFLRATSLDELPQLFNILKGDMSLVGPRPHPVYEVEEYKEWYKRRLNVKPGLTGWSKLNLRCTPKNYEEAILYDLWYVDNWSVSLDVRIILMTIPFVLSMKDAR